MIFHLVRHESGPVQRSAQGWLMHIMHLLGERLGHPAYLYTDQLSPHLLRDIGLIDGRMPGPRSRP